jgi:hypothetical protein
MESALRRKESTMEFPESIEVQRHRAAVEREAEFRLLEARVRRRLRDGRLVLHKSRGERQTALFGRYWITDTFNVMPILHHVDLPSLAQRLHVWFGDLKIK